MKPDDTDALDGARQRRRTARLCGTVLLAGGLFGYAKVTRPALVDPSATTGALVFALAYGAVPLLFGAVWLLTGELGHRRARRRLAAPAPWTDRRAWSGQALHSTAAVKAWGWTGIALVMNALVWANALSIADEGAGLEGGVIAALALFVLAGFGVVVIAVRALLDLQRHGTTPLTLSPFPGTLGGEVRGRVALSGTVPDGAAARVRLKAVRIGGGERATVRTLTSRARRVAVQHDERGPFVAFALDAPDGCPPSDVGRNRPRHAWYLELELEAVGLSRLFEVPVFPDTGHHVRDVCRPASPVELDVPVAASAVRTLRADGSASADGVRWRGGPLVERPWMAAALAIPVCLVWLGVDIGLGDDEASGRAFGWTMAVFCGLVGAALAGVLGMTHDARLTDRALILDRRWCGRFRRRVTLGRDEVGSIDVVSAGTESAPGHSRSFFDVRVRTRTSGRAGHVVAAGISGRERADEVATMLRRWAAGEDDVPGR